jgi:hypothetical protein
VSHNEYPIGFAIVVRALVLTDRDTAKMILEYQPGGQPMRIRIQVAAADDAKAWGILIRHSPGEAYPDRTFVISEAAAQALRQAGIEFVELARDDAATGASGVISGEKSMRCTSLWTTTTLAHRAGEASQGARPIA